MSRRHLRAAPGLPTAGRRPQAAASPPSSLQQAWALFARGERAQAESLCRAVLARNPLDPGAMSLLGILQAQSGRTAEAAELLGRVTELTPADPAAHNNYGNALRDLGRYTKALTCYERALELLPDYADAHYNRGIILQEQGRLADALAGYDRALAVKPDYAPAWNNRGTTLRALGRLEDALDSHRRAAALRPGYAEAHNNEGVALQELGRLEEALASHERATALKPDYADAHHNRGAALQKLGRLEPALESYERAIAARPTYAEAYDHRGTVLQALDRHGEALASYDRAIALKADYVEAYVNRGSALRALRRLEEAVASLDRALAIDPRCFEAHRNRGAVLIDLKRYAAAADSYERALALKEEVECLADLGMALVELKRFAEAISCYRRAVSLNPDGGWLLGVCRHVRMQVCDWEGFDADIGRLAGGIERDQPVARPFAVLSLLDSPRLQRKVADRWVRSECTPARALPPLARHPRHERIRIGYLSADLRNHAVAALTAELFESHDRSRFELTAFSIGADVHDDLRARVEPAFDRFLPVGGQSDHEIAELARRLEIDIAVDLGGYTAEARPRILALRAAPIQVGYLGYLGTMGGDFMDYLLADRMIIPAAERPHYAEKIAYLPSYQVNDSQRPVAERQFTRAELGLPATGFVFCCFNASWKITPETFASWMRILDGVPGSVLFLLASRPEVERNLREHAGSLGIGPERLVFGGVLPVGEYLARYRAADLFLDTSPYNAGTTGSDALWAGLPLLTFPGRTFAARVAASLLTATGLPELIAPDRAAYERLAIELATQPQRLAALRRRLAQMRASCALFDTRTFTRNIEAIYQRMYQRCQSGLPPEDLELS
jgi:predicted O-linked N-acetylglucosamine transferase (SPINDLY family)